MLSSLTQWFKCSEKFDSPIVSQKFNLVKTDNAKISIVGLGFYILYINGKRVSIDLLTPLFSDFMPRNLEDLLYPLSDKTSHRIYYDEYDVTNFLTEGENIIIIHLGNGWFRQTERIIEGELKFSDNLIGTFSLKCGKTIIEPNDTIKISESFIVENNLFYGEYHNYKNKVKEDFIERFQGKTEGIQLISSPNVPLYLSECPKDREIRRINPVFIRETDNRKIYDCGENITGFVEIVAGKSERITVRHAEVLNDYGLDFFSAGGKDQISSDTYVEFINGETLYPRFSWSGFRYFEIEGNFASVSVVVVHTDIKVTSAFNSGNKVLNWLYNSYIRTQLNNIHCGVPSDCPHRERLGYTGDGQLISEGAMLLLDSRKLFKKWIIDIADCQDIISGHVQHTAPFNGGGGGPGGWGGAMVIVPYNYYRIFGDNKLIDEVFPNIIAYIDCMDGFTDNGLIVRERDKGWCLGDWCTPEKVALPEPFVNTYYYILCMQYAEELANFIGKKVNYCEKIEKSKRAISQKYFDFNNGSFCGGIQGADAFALNIGLGDGRTEKNLIDKYSELKKFDTGIFGTEILTSYLVKEGYINLLYKLLSSEDFPSFGYMMKNGTTTLWEDWNGCSSHDHPMFGACVKDLFYGLLGIKPDIGLKKVKIKPSYIDNLPFIEGKIDVFGGNVYVKHTFSGGVINSVINVCGNADVAVVFPDGSEIKCDNGITEVTI